MSDISSNPNPSFTPSSSSSPSPKPFLESEVPLETPFEKLKRKLNSAELPREVQEVIEASKRRAFRISLGTGLASAVGTAFFLRRYKFTPFRATALCAGAGFIGVKLGKLYGAVLAARDLLKLPNPEVREIFQEFRKDIHQEQSASQRNSSTTSSAWDKLRTQSTSQTLPPSSSPSSSSTLPPAVPPLSPIPISPPPFSSSTSSTSSSGIEKKIEPIPIKPKRYNQYGDELE